MQITQRNSFPTYKFAPLVGAFFLRACSSIGQSQRLITVWLQVRVLPSPPKIRNRNMDKTYLFIDAQNIHRTARELAFEIDYVKLIEFFGKSHDIKRAYYYTALSDDGLDSSLRPLIDFLDYNGYTIVQKPNTKRNLGIQLAVDAMVMAPHADHIVIFSGMGDFTYLVEALQRHTGCRVTVVSTFKTTPVMVSDSLRRQADAFIDLASLEPQIARTFD